VLHVNTFRFCALHSLAQNVYLCIAGAQMSVLYLYVVVDWLVSHADRAGKGTRT